MKHYFTKYDVTERFDRVCVLLRRDDFEILRANHPHGVSHWIRERVAERVDEIVAEQRRRAKAERKGLLAAIRDPNL